MQLFPTECRVVDHVLCGEQRVYVDRGTPCTMYGVDRGYTMYWDPQPVI